MVEEEIIIVVKFRHFVFQHVIMSRSINSVFGARISFSWPCIEVYHLYSYHMPPLIFVHSTDKTLNTSVLPI